jgi:hypothetical protein
MNRRSMAYALATVLVGVIAGTAHATTHRFCANWAYHYRDAGFDEDYLLHTEEFWGYPYGVINANHTYAEVYRDGQFLWWGWLNSVGCTPTFPGQAGQYTFRVRSHFTKGYNTIGTFPRVAIFNNTGEGSNPWSTPGFQSTMNLPSASTPQTHRRMFGLGHPIASVAAIIAHALNRSDHGFQPGTTYLIYADQPGDASYSRIHKRVHIGFDQRWQYKLAHSKSTVAHEVGHAVMDGLMGMLHTTFDMKPPESVPVCRCDHVKTGSQAHCLQSREKISTAQNEGWANFYAVNLFNNPNHSDAYFAYYKEVFLPPFFFLDPPVKVNTYAPIQWMRTYCPLASRGVELDWLQFYWWVRNKGVSSVRYSFANFNSVYRRACTGGSGACTNEHDALWSQLVNAINALPLSADKRQHWVTTGANYGVNY